MRVLRSFSSLLVLTVLASACGGSTPPAESPPSEAAPTPSEAAPAAEAAKPADDDAWVGEKAAGSGDSAPSAAAAAPAPGSGPSAPADTKGVETRTMEVIAATVKENRKAARKCYDDARKDLKDLKGDVVIHFVLDPEGKVKKAELNQERSTLKSPVVVDCVLGVIKAIQFPKSSRAMETTANYPFNFTP